ncbi:MAG: S8 family serine peptidase [Bacteroidota bacterium]|nr:S8 family serine peptidase [Bacteroidota bacterium]
MRVYLLIFIFLISLEKIFSQDIKEERSNQKSYFIKQSDLTEDDYIQNRIIFKVKADYKNKCFVSKIDDEELGNILSLLKAKNVFKKFPHHKTLLQNKSNSGETLTDLSLIYEVEYTNTEIPFEKAVNMIKFSNIVEYAEPHYIPHPLYNTNDPGSVTGGQQYYLTNIKAYEAWNICKGDSNIVIGITDSGIDFNHPDLKGSIKYNYKDPIDSVDNDDDGYVDNFRGWDLGDNDNDPTCNLVSTHGVLVSGFAGAVTDNNIGMAGVGFRCKILPVKVSNKSGAFTAAYEGIVYAADHGCQIINCSWGGTAGYSQYEQDIINYATFNKDALVVAAAGNSGSQCIYYPASYDNVISVAGTNKSDNKWSGSTYGPNIDICAPGEGVYTTTYGGGYSSVYSGTSYACPIIAGCAAIVKSYFPDYSAIQIGEQLKVTADNIDNISGNETYKGLLGRGRVNLYRALTETNTPSIEMTDKTITDDKANIFYPGDNIYISGVFKNYLKATTNLTLSLSCNSPYIQIINSSTYIGTLQTFEETDNSYDRLSIKLLPNIPVNTQLLLKIQYTDGKYSEFQYIPFMVNKDYIDVNVNSVSTTITSKGRIGYNIQYSNSGNCSDSYNESPGVGFNYNLTNMLFNAGLIVAVSPTKVASYDSSFSSVSNVKLVYPSHISDFDLKSVFRDNSSLLYNTGVTVLQNTYAWKATQYQKFVIVEYKIKNPGKTIINNLFAGIYADWNITSNTGNLADYDSINKMGYVYKQYGKYGGIKLLTPGKINYYAFNNDGSNGSIGTYNGISKANKYKVMSGGILRSKASIGDVSHILSAGPYNINPGDSVIVAFALIAGDNFNDLKTSAISADKRYNLRLISPNGGEVYKQGDNRDIKWNYGVANKINIEISEDGGKTYSLLAGAINATDGLYKWNINSFTPAGNKYRIRVSDLGSSQKDVSDADFTIQNSFCWTGNINNDWFNISNWNVMNRIPSDTDDVYIPSDVKNMPIINNEGAACNNMNINWGGSINISSCCSLKIKGNWVNNSNYRNTGNGTCIFNGTGSQSIIGKTDFNNLTLNNINGLILRDSVRISGIVYPEKGNINTNGILLLQSDAHGTALISGKGEGMVKGGVMVQKYISGPLKWHYISSPVQKALISQLGNNMDLILGPVTQTYPAPTCFSYNEQKGIWEQPGIYFDTLKGLAVDLQNTTLNIFGEVNNDSLTANVTNEGVKNNPELDGWNLIGNPYPSPIDWDGEGWTRKSVLPGLYFFNNTTYRNGFYTSYISGISNNGAADANIIPIMQGFLVKAIYSGSLSINNKVRRDIINPAPAFYKTNNDQRSLIRLSASGNSGYIDYTVIYFDTNATTGFDDKYDALKLKNTESQMPNIYTVTGSVNLSINALPVLVNDSDVIVPVKFESLSDGDFKISLIDATNFPVKYHIYIEDKKNKSLSNFINNPVYSFTYSTKELKDRFYIHFTLKEYEGIRNIETPGNDIFVWNDESYIYVNSNNGKNIDGNISLSDITGKQIIEPYKINSNSEKIKLPVVSKGIYIVSVVSKSGVINKKIIIN